MNKEYWNKRVEDNLDDKDKMVWLSCKIFEHLNWFNTLMQEYKDGSVLDVGCGWGRVSPLFNDYHGIDFSDKIIDVARKEFPHKSFEVADAYTYTPTKKYDLILVFHLSGLPEREKEVEERYLPFANKALVIVYANRIVNINPNL